MFVTVATFSLIKLKTPSIFIVLIYDLSFFAKFMAKTFVIKGL